MDGSGPKIDQVRGFNSTKYQKQTRWNGTWNYCLNSCSLHFACFMQQSMCVGFAFKCIAVFCPPLYGWVGQNIQIPSKIRALRLSHCHDAMPLLLPFLLKCKKLKCLWNDICERSMAAIDHKLWSLLTSCNQHLPFWEPAILFFISFFGGMAMMHQQAIPVSMISTWTNSPPFELLKEKTPDAL